MNTFTKAHECLKPNQNDAFPVGSGKIFKYSKCNYVRYYVDMHTLPFLQMSANQRKRQN